MRRGFFSFVTWLAGLAAPFMRKPEPEPDTREIRVDYSPAVDGSEYRPVGTIVPAAAAALPEQPGPPAGPVDLAGAVDDWLATWAVPGAAVS